MRALNDLILGGQMNAGEIAYALAALIDSIESAMTDRLIALVRRHPWPAPAHKAPRRIHRAIHSSPVRNGNLASFMR